MKYKRKFLVSGETPKGKNDREREAMCSKLCGGPLYVNGSSNKNREHTPCLDKPSNVYYYRVRHWDRCLHPEEMFNQYMVSETEDGEWQCSCKAWTTHKPRKDCKHIVKAKDDPEKYEIDPDWTGKTTQIMKKVLS